MTLMKVLLYCKCTDAAAQGTAAGSGCNAVHHCSKPAYVECLWIAHTLLPQTTAAAAPASQLVFGQGRCGCKPTCNSRTIVTLLHPRIRSTSRDTSMPRQHFVARPPEPHPHQCYEIFESCKIEIIKIGQPKGSKTQL